MGYNLILIKLGGSVVTFKEKPLAANFKAIDDISHILASLKIPIIIVHGGGSFGHYWSLKYDMHTKPREYDLHGISIVHESMIALNQIIVNHMIKGGMNPYAVMPSIFTLGHKPIEKKIIRELKNNNSVNFSRIVADVTGGMRRKVIEALKISGSGIDVLMLNGLKPERIINAMIGSNFEGTLLKGWRSRK